MARPEDLHTGKLGCTEPMKEVRCTLRELYALFERLVQAAVHALNNLEQAKK